MNKEQKAFVEGMRKVGKIAKATLDHIEPYIKAGVTTAELDKICHDFTLTKGATPGPLGYCGFPNSICTSVNNVICHGLPDDTILEEGDIINIDVTPIYNGYYGDTSRTFIVGKASKDIEDLVDCAYKAMWEGINILKPGLKTGDIGNITEKFIKKHGFAACRDIGGHGIGTVFHTDPFIPAFGRKGKGFVLQPWTCITVEPAVNHKKTASIEIEIPGSTVTEILTENDCFSAQFEHTILITDSGFEIMTL
jgi:methionyl aminopeptidase